METMMLQIKVNSTEQPAYTVQTKTVGGKEYMIVPVVMSMEGVHNGSRGAVLHLEEELKNSVNDWEGRPVTISHPKENGVFVSADSPEILQLYGVGEVHDVYMENKRLKGKIWLDTQKLVALSPETFELIQNNQIIEVSIGVFSEEEEVQGNYNGENYTTISHNYTPDHLALLPGEVGACSVMDGCGIRVNNEQKKGGKDVNRLEVLKQAQEVGLKEVNSNFFVYVENGEDYRQEFKITTSTDGTSASYELGDVIKVNNVKKEEKSMCELCKEKAQALIANTSTHFTEEDREWLEGLTEDKLDKLIPKVFKVTRKEEPEVTVEQAWKVLGLNKEQYDRGVEIYKAQRAVVIENILANTEKDVWTKEELEGMEPQVLQKIEKSVKKETKGNYAAMSVRDINGAEIAPMLLPEVEFKSTN